MIKDIVGQKFGKLTVIKFIESVPKAHSTKWLCVCDCGKELIVQANNLRSGHTRSCGCLYMYNSLTHGHTIGNKSTRAYYIWSTMKARCHNPNHEKYMYYGARGISVCDRWKIFENFLLDMGNPPDKMQIDRIDNNGNYEKSNCQWVTKSENMRNRRDTIMVTYNNERISLVALAEKLNIPSHALKRRVRTWNMDINDALKSCENLRRVRNAKKTSKNSEIKSAVNS